MDIGASRTRGVWVVLLFLFVAVLAATTTAPSASATPVPTVASLVGVSAPKVITIAGPPDHIAAAEDHGPAQQDLLQARTAPRSRSHCGALPGAASAPAGTAVMVHKDTSLLDLTVKARNGALAVLHTTLGHPIWDDTTHTWVTAGKLVPGQRLHGTAAGAALTVTGAKAFTRSSDMWDLTVATDHSFYVMGTGPGGQVGTPVLVHNTSCSLRAYVIADKTVEKHGLMGFESPDAMAKYIDDVVSRQPEALRDDGSLIYREGDNFISIPGTAKSPGTLFRPPNPDSYWDEQLQRTVPF